jgi:hypothetical protein
MLSSAKPSCSAGEIRDADVVSIALLSSAGISAELMTSSRLRYAGEILVEYVQHAYLCYAVAFEKNPSLS